MKPINNLFIMIKEVRKQKRYLRASKEQMEQAQQKKFLELVQFISQNSPYYAQIIKENNIDVTHCTPEDFPVLTKQQLIEHFDEIVTDRRITKAKLAHFFDTSHDVSDLFMDEYTAIHTSGSSGTIGYYVYSQRELLTGLASTTRATGLHLFQTIAYVAATRGHFAGASMINAARSLPFLYKDVEMLDINAPFDLTIATLNRMQPTTLGGYAFALRQLAEAQVKGNLHITPSIIQSGGEPLSQNDKRYIQKAFDVPVVNVYASSEHMIMGLGKDSFEGMYLMEDNLIFELKPTETRITNLYNYTLPLIRYQMSDHLEPIADITNDMPFTKIKEVVGRHESVPFFLNDDGNRDFISPHMLTEFIVKGLVKYQVHLIDEESFEFHACLEKDLSRTRQKEVVKAIDAGLRTILNEKLMTGVQFRIKCVEHLWAHPKTGKFALIVKR